MAQTTVHCRDCERELTTVGPMFGHALGCPTFSRSELPYRFPLSEARVRETNEELDLTPALEESLRRVQQDKRGFDAFMSLVRDSVDGQAARKGYTANGADGDNALYRFTKEIGASAGHSIGEIIYKATEYMKEPREVLLFKIAGWAYMEWKYGMAGKK